MLSSVWRFCVCSLLPIITLYCFICRPNKYLLIVHCCVVRVSKGNCCDCMGFFSNTPERLAIVSNTDAIA